MIGILIALAASWLLLFYVENKSILALGFLPAKRRFKQFLIGFVITGIICTFIQYIESYLKSSAWTLNEKITLIVVVKSLWWDIKSVFTEELIFRGALLFILIQKIDSKWGILVSAIAFGIYHWFSFNILGNLLAMVLIFIGTGIMGFAWAWAFSKTKSIMLPFGLHLGWNFVHNTIFSKGPLGNLVMVSEGGMDLTESTSLLNFLTGMVLAPILVVFYVKYFVKEENNT